MTTPLRIVPDTKPQSVIAQGLSKSLSLRKGLTKTMSVGSLGLNRSESRLDDKKKGLRKSNSFRKGLTKSLSGLFKKSESNVEKNKRLSLLQEDSEYGKSADKTTAESGGGDSSINRAVSTAPQTINDKKNCIMAVAIDDDYNDACDPSLNNTGDDFITGPYRTITQNEYFTELTGDFGFAIVHFFDNRTLSSAAIDKHLAELAPLHPSCKFLRICHSHTPYTAAELRSFPAVVAFKDGIMEARLSNCLFEKLSKDDLNEGTFIKKFVIDGCARHRPKMTTKSSQEAPSANNNSSRSKRGLYRTINEKDFSAICKDPDQRSTTIVVHFYCNSANIKISTAIDKQMLELAKVRTECKFFRLNAKEASLTTSSLGVTTFPDVLLFRQGEVETRLSDLYPDLGTRFSDSELDKGTFLSDFLLISGNILRSSSGSIACRNSFFKSSWSSKPINSTE